MSGSRWRYLALLSALAGCEPVIDHSPAGNLIDVDSSSFEAGVGDWVGWFSAAISREPAAARLGGAGLRVEVTGPFGWGIQTDNFPGFPAAPGAYRASFWARAAQGGPGTATMQISWRDEGGAELQADALETPVLTVEWVRRTLELTAPAGTERVSVSLTGDEEGDPGERIDFDAFVLSSQP